MAGLLVSVRSAVEAAAAVDGGAAVIDVKEPSRGPLGRAAAKVWAEVRQAVPAEIPVSVALGELADGAEPTAPGRTALAGIAFRKLGLAGAGQDWIGRWAGVRAAWGGGPAWVAVVYADAEAAASPPAEAILAA